MSYEDPLKTITEKEYKIMAHLEFIKDILWVEGYVTNINGKDTPLKGDTHDLTVEQEIKNWKSYVETTLTSPEWKDGKHCGDCTKVPATCFRCMCEERLKETRKFIENFEKLINQ